MHSNRRGYRSSTASNTAELIVKPVISSSGSPRPWRSKYSRAPLTGTLLPDIGPRGVAERLVAGAAERLRRRALGTRALVEPRRPVAPPRAGRPRRARQPRVGVFGQRVVGPVGRLRVSGRVDERGDVTAGGEHEPGVRAEQ